MLAGTGSEYHLGVQCRRCTVWDKDSTLHINQKTFWHTKVPLDMGQMKVARKLTFVPLQLVKKKGTMCDVNNRTSSRLRSSYNGSTLRCLRENGGSSPPDRSVYIR